MKLLIFSLGLYCISFQNLILAQANDFSKVKIKIQTLTKHIHMLQGAGGNIAVSSGSDGVFIIDDQYAPLNGKIISAIKKISPHKIRFVINTHWHGDHTGGNEKMGQAGSVIIAHDNVRKRMSMENFNKVFKRKTPASPQKAWPVLTFPSELSLHLNGEQTHIKHFSHAHTDGDSVVHFLKSNVIHTGDIFFNGFYPFIDVDSGGSLTGVITAVKAILKLANNKTKIIPGHGPLANKADLEKYLVMLTSVNLKISKLIKDGKSLEQVVSHKPTSPLDKKWGLGFMKPDVFTSIAYRSLKGLK